jgi:predicted nucleotidyltransferase
MADSKKINLAVQYAKLLRSVLGNNLVSVFLFGSVVRGEDTQDSDIDVMAVVIEPPAAAKLKEMGSLDRFNNVKGRGEFEDISCAVVARNVFLANVEMGMPREGVNPLTEALVLYDTGLMKGLREQLKKGSISLREDAYWDYLRYGDIRRSYLCESIEYGNLKDAESIEYGNLKDARSDAAASATHYLRAYFLCECGEMIVSKRELVERIHEVHPGIAGMYDRVLNGDFNGDEVMDTLEEIRDWVTGCIFGK